MTKREVLKQATFLIDHPLISQVCLGGLMSVEWLVLPQGWMVAAVLPQGWPPTALLVITGPRSPSRCIRADAGQLPLVLPTYHLATIRGAVLSWGSCTT